MRQSLKPEDEQHLAIRALSINYTPSSREGSHVHKWPQFLYSKKGAIRALVGNRIWVIPPRRALWIPAGQQHALTMLGPTELRTLYCSPVSQQIQRHAGALDVSPLLHEAILRCCSLQYLDLRNPSELLLAGLIMDEIASAGSSSLYLELPTDSRARKLTDHFIRADKKAMSLEEMCSDVGLSRRTAERLFLKETGISPARWRRLAVLSQSLEHLLDGISIADTTERAGYASRSAFTEAFSQAFGFPPSSVQKELTTKELFSVIRD